MYVVNLVIEFFSSIVAFILLLAVLNESRIEGKNQFYLICCIACIFFLDFADANTWYMLGNPDNILKLKVLFTISYVSMEMTIYFFAAYMVNEISRYVYINKKLIYYEGIYLGFMSLMYIFGMFVGLYIEFDSAGGYHYTDFWWFSQVGPILAMAFNFILAASCHYELPKGELFAWISFGLFPILFLPFMFLGASAVLSAAVTFSALIVYIFIHQKRVRQMALQETELMDSKMKIMVSQIQPHFLYNSLNAIYYLVGRDPEEAQRAIKLFSNYLRANIDSLKGEGNVPLETEIKHIDAYLELEKMRFDDDLQIVYDIEAKDIMVPPLGIQPIVENAVKHGLGVKEGGGTVMISSRSYEGYDEIVIKDDGVGFDLSQTPQIVDGREHVGIDNVSRRLESLCGAKVTIESVIGKGTTVSIRFPKNV